MTTLYLVRHASYDESHNVLPGRLPVALSKKGVTEAYRLRDYFKDKNITKIFASAVERCKQTSEIIADGTITIEYDQRLLEVLSAYQGFWEQDWSQFWGHRHVLGGEENGDVQQRVMDFFTTTAFDENANYIICSHGNPLYYIYESVADVPPLPSIELGDRIVNPPDYQKMGSVRILQRNNGAWFAVDVINQENLA